jgi:hypothetical protein
VGLGFGTAKGEDVLALIAKKNYTKAIEVLKKGKADPRTKLQLADVLVLARKEREAVAVLLPLADEFAREGFAAKAISVLKKVQKIDPSRRDVEQRLASLIQAKQQVATVSLSTMSPARGGLPEIGIEEIGMEPLPSGLASGPAGLEIGMEAGPEVVVPTPAPPPAPAPRPAPLPSPTPAAEPLKLEVEPLVLDAVAPPPSPPPLSPAPPSPAPAKPAALVDTDFFTEEDLQLVEPETLTAEPIVEAEVEAEVVPEPGSPADPMSDSRFAQELMGLVDSLVEAPAAAEAGAAAGAPETGQQIVVSPLFQAFSVDEMVAVIAGLKLLTFERGDVIIRQGQPGNSLYMLTAGKVRAFVKRDGKNIPVADLSEGAFFGEGSILTGKPRSATVAALTSCELLELDRPTLDDIASRHPHVMDVLREFAARRIR